MDVTFSVVEVSLEDGLRGQGGGNFGNLVGWKELGRYHAGRAGQNAILSALIFFGHISFDTVKVEILLFVIRSLRTLSRVYGSGSFRDQAEGAFRALWAGRVISDAIMGSLLENRGNHYFMVKFK